MCGPPKEQCEPFCYEEDESNESKPEYDPDLAAEEVRHLTHDECGNRLP